MKKPERLVGFVIYDGVEFAFEFNEDTFSVSLYPPSKRTLEKYAHPMYFFNSFKNSTGKHEWIQQKRIEGTTSERYTILFDVQDSPALFNGFITFQVNWFIIFDGFDINSISGFVIASNIVDYFYPSEKAINAEVQFGADSQKVEKMTVSSTGYSKAACGKYRIAPKIDAVIEVAAYATIRFNNSANPINASSTFTTLFSTPVDIEILLKAYYNARLFFEYITYRQNAGLGDIKVFFLNNNGKNEFAGILVFPPESEKETSDKEKSRIIKYDLLSKKTAKIFIAIKNRAMGFQYICNSIEGTRHYPSSRIIMILAEFEREYRDIFGQDKGRSDEYLETKKTVIELIGHYEKSQQGKQRRYANQLKKYVENRDNSFEAAVKYALIDCENVLSIFVKRQYKEPYNDAADGIAERMGLVRNGIAHSHIDLRFDAVHLSDINIIEELIYAMRLRKIGLTDKECQKAINDLFGENFGL